MHPLQCWVIALINVTAKEELLAQDSVALETKQQLLYLPFINPVGGNFSDSSICHINFLHQFKLFYLLFGVFGYIHTNVFRASSPLPRKQIHPGGIDGGHSSVTNCKNLTRTLLCLSVTADISRGKNVIWEVRQKNRKEKTPASQPD